MQCLTENVIGMENKLQNNSIKIRNRMYGFKPVSNILHAYIKLHHTRLQRPIVNNKIKKILTHR